MKSLGGPWKKRVSTLLSSKFSNKYRILAGVDIIAQI